MSDPRTNARRLMQQYLDRDDALGWFETLYSDAANDPNAIPWADLAANPNLVAWIERESFESDGRKALVVGCGLGDDAEYLASRGFEVIAYDLSATAIAWSKRRFPDTTVQYRVADLLKPPREWIGQFDFVLEVYTLQTLTPELRREATAKISGFLAPGGKLLVITRGRDATDDPGPMPWPLTREEIERFTDHGLEIVSFEDYNEKEDRPVRRFRAVFQSAQVSDEI